MAKRKNQEIDWVTYSAFVEEFKGETDRAAVVLGAAKLDLVMYQILKSFLVPSASSKDELMDGDSPLGTFSSKINMMHRLGLIDSSFARALHIIRKIRNSFAHEVSGCLLQSGAHSDRVKELSLPFKHLPFYKSFKIHFFGDKNGSEVEFRAVLSLLVGRLEAMLLEIEVINYDDAWRLFPANWEEEEDEKSSNKEVQQTAKRGG